MKDNLEAVEAIWDYSYDCGIGYCEINTAIDHCLECGFEGEYNADEKGYHCPNCGNSNPETSDVTRRTCFTSGHYIETNNGYKPIEDIKIGENVRTAKGTFEPVIDTMQRTSNDLITISLSGLEDMTSTSDHPYFTKLTKDSSYEIHRADELQVGSYIGIKINDKQIPIKYKKLPTEDIDFWWLVGRIIGDGFISNDRGKKRAYLTIGKHDKDIDKLVNILNKLSLGFRPLTETRTFLRTNTYNKTFCEFMSQIGHRAENKQIPTKWLDLPNNLAEALLDGYLSADGCKAQNKQICNSVSKGLLYGIGQLILKTKHKTYCLYKNRNATQMEIENRIVNTLPRYDLKYTLGIPRFNFIEDGYAYIKVTDIKHLTESQTVYNLTVENEHTYTVNNVNVHNCGYLGNPMKRPMKKGRQAEIIHRVKHISGSLGQLSNGNDLQSDDADELKVRK